MTTNENKNVPIAWTVAKLELFKQAYRNAVSAGVQQFIFKDGANEVTCNVEFAKYLITVIDQALHGSKK